MRFGTALVFLRFLSFIVGLTGIGMIPSIILAIFENDGRTLIAFALPAGAAIAFALVSLFATRKRETRFTVYQGLLLVSLAWALSCVLGAVPFTLSGRMPAFADAVFESASGFTTTGATLFTDVEALPRSLLFWRAMTHWLGGMGLVVLTVALAPLLGVGGFQLSTSLEYEAPGPESGKLTPRLTSTAKILWLIYVALTFIEAILLLAGGMNLFDAVTHSFSTMATGGFSNYNASIEHFNSPYIEWVIAVFMFLAGANFNLIYLALLRRWRDITSNSELKAYAGVVAVATAVGAVSLAGAEGAAGGIREGFFHVATIVTTTGFNARDITTFLPLAQAVLFFMMFIGGCSGSTAGGVKVIRHLILWKQTGNEVKKLCYPRGVFSITIDGKEANKRMVYGVAGFAALYSALVVACMLAVATTGMGIFESLNVSLISVGNIGLGLIPDMAAVMAAFPGWLKWLLSFAMVAGRLELWTVFALFFPQWKVN
jgi:trk system potassium uptake protein TrkH